MINMNVTGWDELMTGNIANAAFVALDEPIGGLLVFAFYFIVIMTLWVKTQSPEVCTIISLIFLAVFLSSPWFNDVTKGLAIVMTAFLLGASIFKFIAKEKNI